MTAQLIFTKTMVEEIKQTTNRSVDIVKKRLKLNEGEALVFMSLALVFMSLSLALKKTKQSLSEVSFTPRATLNNDGSYSVGLININLNKVESSNRRNIIYF